MKLSLNLSEWLAQESSKKVIEDYPQSGILPLNSYSVEIFYKDLIANEQILSKLIPHDLNISNLRINFPLLENKKFPDQLWSSLVQVIKKWKISNLTLVDTTHYSGNQSPIKTRLSDEVMTTELWQDFTSVLNKLGDECLKLNCNFLVSNHSGCLIERAEDFEKLNMNNFKYGFYFDVPHFLFINETLSDLSEKTQELVHGFRLGSYTPCSWVVTRQNRYSWDESVKFGIFEPFKIQHKKMLANFWNLIALNYPKIKTLSLTCERKNELNEPLANLNEAQKAFNEIILPELKKTA